MSSVCAIGYFTEESLLSNTIKLPDDLNIIGTAFRVTDSIIVTNNHVLRALSDLKKDIKDWKLVFFDNLTDTQNIFAVTPTNFYPSPVPEFDIGFIEVDLVEDLSVIFALPDYGNLADIHITQRVGVIGFPQGKKSLDISVNDKVSGVNFNIKRFSPLVHAGIISGQSPFVLGSYKKSGITGYHLPHTSEDFNCYAHYPTIITNIALTGGFSGAPLIDIESGKIIGIHSSSIKNKNAVEGNIGIAYCLSQESIETFIILSWAFANALYESDQYDDHNGICPQYRERLLIEMKESDHLNLLHRTIS
jgi:S1-C subfamily serine protease